MLSLLGGAVASFPLTGTAQQPAKVHRIGFLTAMSRSNPAFSQQFTAALRDLGYVEGQNLVLDWHSGQGSEHLAEMAVELVRRNPDVIVTATNPHILAVKAATRTIPIVMFAGIDPIGSGLVESLARPGGNVTGSVWWPEETAGKVVTILKEAIPGSRRVAFLVAADYPGASSYVQVMQVAAQALGVMLRVIEVRPTDEPARILEDVRLWQADSLIVSSTFGHQAAILTFASQQRLPAIYTAPGNVEQGGLMAYLPSGVEVAQRTARYVDRILKGSRPAELPVEQPTRFDLVVNLKTARAMGLELPPAFLARVDEVIE
jgi:putative ABC transport system substrate-binding protein